MDSAATATAASAYMTNRDCCELSSMKRSGLLESRPYHVGTSLYLTALGLRRGQKRSQDIYFSGPAP